MALVPPGTQAWAYAFKSYFENTRGVSMPAGPFFFASLVYEVTFSGISWPLGVSGMLKLKTLPTPTSLVAQMVP